MRASIERRSPRLELTHSSRTIQPDAKLEGGLTPQQFVEKWSRVELSERSASQQHFIDLCRMLGQPAPADHDATGAEYAFEKGVDVTAGASAGAKGDYGFADVWWKDKFAWEYKRKGKYKDLDEAYRQLLQYREALGNPPLLVVSDIARTEIHTNFTGTTKQVHCIALREMTEPAALDKLRRIFTDPESFKPQLTVEKVTQDVAAEIGQLAVALQKRGHAPLDVAHFLMKCVFCLFAEDINLLPNKLFKKLLDRAHHEPAKFKALATQLFSAMKTGGEFGLDPIPFFNGGLFEDADALDLNYSDVGLLLMASGKDWSAVEPHIFGTLFERALDPSKRAQIGAHYTSREDIMLVVEPVVMMPLRREWEDVKSAIMAAAAKDERLKKRTLTNLYNERPTWLKLAHEQLDRAVLSAYAATDPQGQWSEDWAQVWTETGAGQPLKPDHPLAAQRAEVDQKVLANLLRLNHARAKVGGESASEELKTTSKAPRLRKQKTAPAPSKEV